ncbi:uncharacterized protein LOC129788467 [Lutzomyia longipalpis]|uniref:Putative conserved secreted protein n=1 Tax=Lutzomyia longipalpis TaxID=7200 RepID=A0A1B0CSN4_LUTLO|nr:uncharacterized protein LOC129788467 [Lutzomyia longipalpis]
MNVLFVSFALTILLLCVKARPEDFVALQDQADFQKCLEQYPESNQSGEVLACLKKREGAKDFREKRSLDDIEGTFQESGNLWGA